MSTALDRTPTTDATPDPAPRGDRRAAKALLAGGAALALLVGGGTMAALSDFAIVPDNRVGVGTLELEVRNAVNQGPSYVAAFDDLALVPGQSVSRVQLVTVRGAVPQATLAASIVDVEGVEDGCNGAEAQYDDCAAGGEGDLPGKATVRVSALPPGTNANGAPTCNQTVSANVWDRNTLTQTTTLLGVGSPRALNANVTVLEPVTLTAAEAAGPATFRTFAPGSNLQPVPAQLAPDQSVCVGILVSVPEGGPQDNAVQGDRASFDLRLDLVQTVTAP